MRRLPLLLAALFLGALPALGCTQTPWDQGAGFLQGAWEKVKAQGPAAAEAAVRSAPMRFKQVRREVERVSIQVRKMVKEAKLEDKKNLAMQLWEIRGSLDLMSLLNPDTLQALTGVNPVLLRKLQGEVSRLEGLVLRFGSK